jgi:hypothetical protein
MIGVEPDHVKKNPGISKESAASEAQAGLPV